ncbi:MAG: hypothetical protein AAGI46_16335 [Planctomycetota bacterium]
MSERRPSLRELLRPGIRGVRANWRPFVLLQLVAFAVVVSYYQVDFVREALSHLEQLKERHGYLFAGAASAIAGALLPEAAKLVIQPGFRLRDRGEEVLFLLVLFFFNGMLVDGFYRLVGHLFGSGIDVPTVLGKTLVDMLGFTPFVALPIVMFAFAIRRHGYRPMDGVREVARTGPVAWYLKRVVPILLPNWAFWVPMVLLIYSMPSGLQIVMFAGALSAWSLVMVFIGNDEATREAEQLTLPVSTTSVDASPGDASAPAASR